ncbi:MAG: T9SS type A sorting domain-containing protein, partial [bacterium]
TAVYANYEAYVLQDDEAPWSGMFVSYIPDQLLRGQTVRITGRVVESDPYGYGYQWDNLTKLVDVTEVTLTETGVINPLSVSTWTLSAENPDVESYEGVLVTVQDVEVTVINQYDWTIDDGSGGCLIDDDASNLGEFFTSLVPGSVIEYVTGFFLYSYGTYKIELRDTLDYGDVPVSPWDTSTPLEFSLDPCYPNPFNATTMIHYTLPHNSSVNIAVYNLLGQEVATLVNGARAVGKHTVVWNGTDHFGNPLASGVYVYSIKAGNFVKHQKMVLLK